jgi:RNA polymerase sigma-70 factor (sigma-E family)
MAEAGDFQDYVLARRRSLLRTAWLLTGDWQTAEDLVQTALMRCYPKWSRIEPGAADAYVRRTMVNLHASAWRRRWRGEVPTRQLPEHAALTDEYAATDERQTLLVALATLTPRQRAAVVLRYFEDLSEADTASALECSVGTVKSQTSKALAALRSNGVLLAAAGDREVTHD